MSSSASRDQLPSPASPDLNEIAALLVQLEPTDRADVERVRGMLAALAADPATEDLDTCALLSSAARALGNVEWESGADATAAIASASRLLEHVMARPAPSAAETTAAGAVRADEADGADALPADSDPDLLQDFVAESREFLVAAEAALLELENAPNDTEAINTVFRAFHTVKGTAAFLGLEQISAFAHQAESLLDRVRTQELAYTSRCADLALRSADMIGELLSAVEAALGGERLVTPVGYQALLGYLSSEIDTMDDAPEASASELAAAFELDAPAAPRRAGTAPSTGDTPAAHRGAESSVRVRTDRLDRLIDLVGEMVIAQSMISGDQTLTGTPHSDVARKVAHAGKIVRELQELSMSMRMVPLKPSFQKVARLVRDLAYKGGKLVEFVTEGEETEIDRNMVDYISDPLVHMVRNAVDHGIEFPSARTAKGKPAAGTIHLSAYHASGNVVVELRDDGRGLDRERIVQKAIGRGLIESDRGMTDSDVFDLIFAPGFSTAEQVTDVSGRGVGMDVVRQNIDALRGHVEIASEPDRGCLFTIRLPLTLAITDGMLVRVGAERYIVPTINIHLSFRPERSMLSTIAGRGEMVLLRGELMPIVRVHQIFGIPGAVEDPERALLMIVGDGDRRAAVLVDELVAQHQVVTKSLRAGLGKVPAVSGGAILGDGRVGLILDVPELIALARQAPESGQRSVA